MGAHYILRTNLDLDLDRYHYLNNQQQCLLGNYGVASDHELERKFYYKDEALVCRNELRARGFIAEVFRASDKKLIVTPDEKSRIGLGDTVSIGAGHDACKVTQVHANGTVDLLRVYVHTSDFSYAGRLPGSSSLIATLGYEEIRDIEPTKLKLIAKNTDHIK